MAERNGEIGAPSQAWAQALRKRLMDALEWDLPRPQSISYGPHEQAFRDGFADCYRLNRAVIEALPAARARVSHLEQAIIDAEAAILGDPENPSEADLRLHEALAPLWAALSDSDGAA